MASTPVQAVGDSVGGGFPSPLFTIEDDPGAVRASAQTYRPMGRQAQATHDTLVSTTVTSWEGSEGDLFRSRRATYEPMMSTAARVFTSVATLLDTFADTLTGIKSRMSELRARAEAIWAQLQAALAARAQAAAGLATAGGTAATAALDPVAAAQAASNLDSAQQAYGQAASAVSALQSQWEACVAEANRLHQELAAAAEATAEAIRALEPAPASPGPSAGGATSVDMASMTCHPLQDPIDGDGDRGEESASSAEAEDDGGGWGSKILDGGQFVLDVVGLVPGVGEIADGTNAAIYLARGDTTNAALSAAAMIPFAGWGATGTKFAVKGSRLALKDAAESERLLAKATQNPSAAEKPLGNAVGGPPLLTSGRIDTGAAVGKPSNPPLPRRRELDWVDEKAHMSKRAQDYQDSAQGARSNVYTRTGQAPRLNGVRFDGMDESNKVLIDRKVSVTTFPKSRNQALRQSAALREAGHTGRWEVPNPAQKARAERMFQDLGIDNISVEVVPE